MTHFNLEAFLQAQLPACHLATAKAIPFPDPNHNMVQVSCAAPRETAAACGYPSRGTCPHAGPFYDKEDRTDETERCLIRQALRH